MKFHRRKAFGQNFLVDQRVVNAILQETSEQFEKLPVKKILEIGPGKGALTEGLIGNYPLLLIEKDRRLAAKWEEEAEVICEDFLEAPTTWSQDAPIGVVANLPYSSGTAILNKLSEHAASISFMILMFQREVGERIMAEKSTSSRGSLSLWTQNTWEVRKLLDVGPRSFRPRPKVASQVLVFHPRRAPRIPETAQDLKLWQSLLRFSFQARRKMLRNTLKSHVIFRNALEASSVDGTKRAEALDWDEWRHLYSESLKSSSASPSLH